jgi:hypothetical protein
MILPDLNFKKESIHVRHIAIPFDERRLSAHA